MDRDVEMNTEYIGDELEIFSKARNWKKYWSAQIFNVIPKNLQTFEIGSGIGNNAIPISRFTNDYTGVEPDQVLVEIARNNLPYFSFNVGSSSDIEFPRNPILVLYIDVLEHIEDDRKELQTLLEKISPNSFVGIIVPAHMSLYSDFDKKIGHYRRYSTKTLKGIIPAGYSLVFMAELDCVGYLLSKLGTRFNRSGNVSIIQVIIWDNLIFISRVLDKLKFFKGKSIVTVLKRD